MKNMETTTIRPGALSFVLQIARFAGVAPLRFKVLRNGYSISVSRLQLAYSYFIITICSAVTIFEIYGVLEYRKQIPYIQQHPTTILLIAPKHIMFIISCMIGYMGLSRMKNIIHHLNILEKIKHQINYNPNNTIKEDTRVIWISSILIFVNIIVAVLNVAYEMLKNNCGYISLTVSSINSFKDTLILLLQIQFDIVNFEVYKVLLQLNEKLHYSLSLADDNFTNGNADTVFKGVRCLTRCYISICNLSEKINKSKGLPIVLILASFALCLVFYGFRLIFALKTSTDTPYRTMNILIHICFCLKTVVRIFFFVEPFQRISNQVEEMKVLLAQIMCHMTPLGSNLSMEVDVLIKQVKLLAPQYTAFGIFTINRSLIITMLNALITYLVYVVQLEE